MLRAVQWGCLVTPDTWARCRVPAGMLLACDNGAWGAHAGRRAWDSALFARMAESVAQRAAWVVCPDVVADARASWELTLQWLPWCLERFSLVLLAVQDGMDPDAVEALLGPRVGIFVGGSTEWKLETLAAWCQIGHFYDAYVHVGRVNSVRRIVMCGEAGADSVDGNNVVLFPVNMPRLDRAMKRFGGLDPYRRISRARSLASRASSR